MERISRVRVVETLPEKRVRSAPRALVPEHQASTVVLVSAEIVHGTVSDEDLARWVQEALIAYHRFRNGWVGVGAVGSIVVPQVTPIEDP